MSDCTTHGAARDFRKSTTTAELLALLPADVLTEAARITAKAEGYTCIALKGACKSGAFPYEQANRLRIVWTALFAPLDLMPEGRTSWLYPQPDQPGSKVIRADMFLAAINRDETAVRALRATIAANFTQEFHS